MNKKPLIYRISRFFIFLWIKVWFRYQTRGKNYVPLTGGCLIASNHASFLDPPVITCSIPHRHVRFIARDTLFQTRLSIWWAANVGIVKIDRTKGDVAALKDAIDVAKQGGVLCVFPEGTRTEDGKLQQPKAGIGFLIEKAGVPVVPAYVDGTFSAFPKGARWASPCKVRVFFGKPVLPFELRQYGKGKEAYKKMAELIMARIAELQP